MLYRRVALWFLPLFVLLVLATMMLFMQLSLHAHAAAPKHTSTISTSSTPAAGGVTPNVMWRSDTSTPNVMWRS
jgi:hypothetical protein